MKIGELSCTNDVTLVASFSRKPKGNRWSQGNFLFTRDYSSLIITAEVAKLQQSTTNSCQYWSLFPWPKNYDVTIWLGTVGWERAVPSQRWNIRRVSTANFSSSQTCSKNQLFGGNNRSSESEVPHSTHFGFILSSVENKTAIAAVLTKNETTYVRAILDSHIVTYLLTLQRWKWVFSFPWYRHACWVKHGAMS